MPSTSAPSDAPGAGEVVGGEAVGSETVAPLIVWHYDGVTGIRHQRRLEIDGEGFRLIDDAGEGEAHPLADLIARPAQDGQAIFGLKNRAGWRIGLAGDVPPEIVGHLPRAGRYGRVIDRFGLWRSVAVFAVLAVIAVTLFLRTPAAVASAVPPSMERKLGDLMVGDFGRRACAGPGGQEALDALVQRIDPGGDRRGEQIEVHVVNLPVVNAVTLPGGRIVIFNRLLQTARSPDEVAGVLAHEIGHVRHRDVMESLLRQLGLGVLLGGLDGQVGGYTNALLSATYSRDAETRADSFALDALDKAHISPAPLAQFFRRLSDDAGAKGGDAAKLMGYFSSHPMSSDRAARFDRAARKQGAYSAALSNDDWASLQAICSSDPQAETPGLRF